jgi:hypothetical protein
VKTGFMSVGNLISLLRSKVHQSSTQERNEQLDCKRMQHVLWEKGLDIFQATAIPPHAFRFRSFFVNCARTVLSYCTPLTSCGLPFSRTRKLQQRRHEWSHLLLHLLLLPVQKLLWTQRCVCYIFYALSLLISLQHLNWNLQFTSTPPAATTRVFGTESQGFQGQRCGQASRSPLSCFPHIHAAAHSPESHTRLFMT